MTKRVAARPVYVSTLIRPFLMPLVLKSSFIRSFLYLCYIQHLLCLFPLPSSTTSQPNRSMSPSPLGSAIMYFSAGASNANVQKAVEDLQLAIAFWTILDWSPPPLAMPSRSSTPCVGSEESVGSSEQSFLVC